MAAILAAYSADRRVVRLMLRGVAIALVALAPFDYFVLDGKYVHAVKMT